MSHAHLAKGKQPQEQNCFTPYSHLSKNNAMFFYLGALSKASTS